MQLTIFPLLEQQQEETLMNSYEQKKQARIDRLNAAADRAAAESNRAAEESSRMASVIPFGQPILLGHHSEKRDRNYRNRIANKMDKAVELDKKAKHYAAKAAAAESNHAISSDDPEAVEKLTEKITKLEKLQSDMREINKLVRKKDRAGLAERFKLSDTKINALFEPDCLGRIGFADYQLTNNNANIRRLKQRLKELESRANQEPAEHEINGVRVVENTDENRLQLFFDGKPEADTRKTLKSHGFRWAPTVGAWQRQLTNDARYWAKHILKALQPQEVKEHQPEPEAVEPDVIAPPAESLPAACQHKRVMAVVGHGFSCRDCGQHNV